MEMNTEVAVRLAGELLAELDSRRQADPGGYMTSLQGLVDVVGRDADDKTVTKALRNPSFTERIVAADAKDRRGPVAFQEDLPALAASPQLLKFLQSKVTREPNQPYLLGDLKKVIKASKDQNAQLKKQFEEALRRQIKAGEVQDVALKKPSPAEVLASRLLAVLESQRSFGGDAYPLTLRKLAELSDVDLAQQSKLLFQSIAKPPFKDRALVIWPKDLDSPAALADDMGQLAASPLMLEQLKAKTARKGNEPYLAADLLKHLPGAAKYKDFKKACADALRKQIETGQATDVVLQRPKVDAAAQLAEMLVKVLESQRGLGGGAYPLTLRKLAALADVDPARQKSQLLQAVKKQPFASRVISAGTDLDAPVVLAEDVEQLATLPQLLEFALRKARTPTRHAFTCEQLVKKVPAKPPALQAAFRRAIDRQLADGVLPRGVGAVLDGSLKLFLLDDLQPAPLRSRLAGAVPQPTETRQGGNGQSARPAASSTIGGVGPATTEGPHPGDGFSEFSQSFESVFTQLDRQHGGHNFVSLAELRTALPDYSRAEFDTHLRRLRLENRFTLSGAQSKHGLPEDLREAGINEAGHLLTYASRRK